MLGSPDADREFLIRSCGILLHGDSVLAQEGRIADGVSYALPGGHVEFGETLAACVSREILEETGLNVEPEKMVRAPRQDSHRRAAGFGQALILRLLTAITDLTRSASVSAV